MALRFDAGRGWAGILIPDLPHGMLARALGKATGTLTGEALAHPSHPVDGSPAPFLGPVIYLATELGADGSSLGVLGLRAHRRCMRGLP